MIVLIDSHALLWFLQGNSQLPPTARALIEDAGNEKLVSIASCWEISIKAGLGKMKLAEPSKVLLEREIPRNNLRLLFITLEHATAVEGLPHHHRDPFDRLLIAQAMCEGVPVVSADAAFDAYPVSRIW
jgi:PIN domain nuclease of toxin-antitoxin system